MSTRTEERKGDLLAEEILTNNLKRCQVSEEYLPNYQEIYTRECRRMRPIDALRYAISCIEQDGAVPIKEGQTISEGMLEYIEEDKAHDRFSEETEQIIRYALVAGILLVLMVIFAIWRS